MGDGQGGVRGPGQEAAGGSHRPDAVGGEHAVGGETQVGQVPPAVEVPAVADGAKREGEHELHEEDGHRDPVDDQVDARHLGGRQCLVGARLRRERRLERRDVVVRKGADGAACQPRPDGGSEVDAVVDEKEVANELPTEGVTTPWREPRPTDP